jgi:hypothetical protein
MLRTTHVFKRLGAMKPLGTMHRDATRAGYGSRSHDAAQPASTSSRARSILPGNRFSIRLAPWSRRAADRFRTAP